MSVYYVGIGGNDGNSGLTWALRKLTLNGAEDVPVAAGDVVYVGPGAYRELLTVDVSGGNTYSVGTVSVTNGSDQVTGAGTTFVGNVAADYLFHVRYYDNGADGVANGTATFTAAGGNFQAAMIGCPIQINARGAYTIAAVAAANSLTLADPHALGWPAAGGGLTYSIMSGEGHYEIESVDDNTTLTLKQNWQGKTLTGLSYLTFNPITYIADVTGENTDDVGGIVRITASDNDQTGARANAITATSKNYRVFRGFHVDMGTTVNIILSDCTHFVLSDLVCDYSDMGIQVSGQNALACTVRRIMAYGYTRAFYISANPVIDDVGHVFENCLSDVGVLLQCFGIARVGGLTARNLTILGSRAGGGGWRVANALTTGQTTYITNSVLYKNSVALYAVNSGEVTENYNTFFLNGTDRTNVNVGASSLTHPPLMNQPILYAGEDYRSGYRFPPPLTGDLSEWSQIAAVTGVDERDVDLYGVPRPATASKCSWGSTQFADMELESGTVQAGSYARALNDAGTVLVRRVPCTNVQTTVTLYMRYEANYAGSLPRMVIKQPGASDRSTVMVAAANTWEQLSDTFTPNASPGYFEVWAESRNTDGANDKVFYDTFAIS